MVIAFPKKLGTTKNIRHPTGVADMSKSKSSENRAPFSHPIIDSDGHTIEVLSAFLDVLKEVAGTTTVERYVKGGGLGSSRWSQASPNERVERRMTRPPWWGVAM